MIVTLLRDARIRHHAGETVTVSPEEGAFLLSVGSAMLPVRTEAEQAPEEKPKKTVTKKKSTKRG